MPWSSRRAVAVLAAFLVGTLGLQLSIAQVDELPIRRKPIGGPLPPTKPRPTDNGSEFSGFDLPTDENGASRIKDIGVYIQVEDWPKAVDLLQGLLDRNEDLFASVVRTTAAGSSKHMVNVRAEASRIISSLPKPGLDFYRLTFGPPALAALKNAKATGDADLLAEVMRRYLYTDAGAEATELLASHLLDRGKYSSAAICFERLFQRISPNQLAPMTLFRAALAFQRAGGENKTNLEATWRHLESRGGQLDFGSRKIEVAELRNYVASRKSAGASRSRYDWPLAFGGPSRSDQGDGGTAWLDPSWKAETMNDGTTKSRVKQVTDFLDTMKQPHLHGFSPIAATLNRGDEGKVPLVIYRDFWGIRARVVKAVPHKDPTEALKAGDVYWESPSAWSIEKMIKEPRYVGQLTSWLQQYIDGRMRPQVLLENSVVGGISTDNVRVFAIEDFQVPPFSQNFNRAGFQPIQPGGGPGGPLGEAMQHNRLQAYDLDSGKLTWEIGQAGGKEPLSDSFFLGAPLPLNGKLYILNEKEQELRLVTLDPATGQLVNKPQRLADMREKIQSEVTRRFNAGHLAYGEGILVCPTNSGGILGVDLLTSSLIWAYGYRDKAVAAQPQPPQPGMGGIVMPVMPGMPGMGGGQPLTQNPTWHLTPPVISEGKVVFTAPDANAIHCVNLRDGSRLWKNPRKEGDLYLAGVFAGKALIVGRNYARAVSLADGAETWSVETGMPSGIGIASKDVYYLPLVQAVKTREPEICLIDLNKGFALAHTRSRKKEIPGNLLFYEGEVLSQSLTHVTSYPQLEVALKDADTKLAVNAKDPEGLTLRGDLKLDKGDLGGAVDDLRLALANITDKTPPDLKPRTRAKLFESLTEYLQRDFDKAEKYVKEYEELCKIDDPAMDPKVRQAEEKRRKGNFYCLVGRGKEAQKDLLGAFRAYMDFGTLGSVDNEMMSVVDDPGVKASPMVWARGRIVAMVEKATKEERAPLEKEVAERWVKIQNSTDLDTLRGFVNTFGSITSVGREARLQLAERLITDNDEKSLVDAERHLSVLRLQQEDPSTAARAVEAMARLMTRKGLMEDAAFFYRILGRDFAKVTVKDGKTGQEYYNDLATDKRFLPYLDEPAMAFSGKVKSDEQAASNGCQQLFALEQEGEKLPFFQQNYKVAMRADYSQFKLMSREKDNEEAWSHTLNGSWFANLFPYNNVNQTVQPRPTFQTLGHLIVVQVGHKVFALDPVTKKQLWEKTLSSSVVQGQFRQQPTVDPRDGSTQIIYADGWMQRLGRSGPLSPIAYCMLTPDGLIGIDPVGGHELWRRNDVSKNSHLYNDEQHVYTIEMALDGTAGTTRVFRLQDGVTVPTRDFSDMYRSRLKMKGRMILASDGDGRGRVLRLYDILTGQDVYRGVFAHNSLVLQPESDDFGGVVEPDGAVTLIDLNTLKTMKLKFTDTDEKGKVLAVREGVRAEHLAKANSLHVLRDGKDIFLVINTPYDLKVLPNQMAANLVPGMGLRALPVNGELYSFDAATGEQNWFNHVENQMLVLDEFERIPVVLLTSRYQKYLDNLRQQANFVAAVRSYDKRTGKLIWDKEDNVNRYLQFHSIKVDARAGRVELQSQSLTWIHSLVAGPLGAGNVEGGKTGALPGTRPSTTVRPDLLPPPPPLPPGLAPQRRLIEN